MATLPMRWRIAVDIIDQIRAGELKPKHQLGTYDDIAERYGCSLAPVKQAFEWLEVRGWIVRRQGVGSFVADEPPVDDPAAYPPAR